ncbi:DUF5064 family protein [Pseudomonas sp. N040]|uniref:DUF5064 family protein n=1 Tax=Pseudomonas sp. N040 TaxID=2785325 RepID=UPI0018A2D8C3|nr:DUF5064 family protein [Pseudomonas sp. N040]MBF7729317.1 DUF5064 family protein [Pseudomonas sp. N040]MBW7012957.1 DUF5064 family protein [Pseudomonas sp. N040]
MFEPGHLHRSFTGLPGMPDGTMDVFYEVRNDPAEGQLMHFKVVGDIAGKVFTEEFDMHRDTAFNFASLVAKAVTKQGLPPNVSPIMRNHQEYDAMFNDIRDKLGAHSGEAVDLDHLEKDGL